MSTIILIPGMWHSARIPALAASLVQAGHEVVPVRLPGDDGSTLPDGVGIGRFSWEDALAAVEGAIDKLSAGTFPILIGEGAGGYLAQIVASRRQTGPIVLVEAPAPIRAWRSPLFFLPVAFREMIGHGYRGGFQAMFSLSARTRLSLTAPVLIHSSERDRFVSRGTSLDLLALYPQADFHRSASDCPEKLCRDIGDWIDALADKPTAPTAPATVSRRRALHHGAPVPGRRDASRIPLQGVRPPLRRVPAGSARRDRAAEAVPDALAD